MNILIATGSSGGHLVPAVGYVEALKEHNPQCRVVMLCPQTTVAERFTRADVTVVPLPHVRLALPFDSSFLKGLYNAGVCFYRTLKALVRHKPDVVVGFGTIHAVPAILLAWFFRIKTVIHEQNVLPGRANRFLNHFADVFCLSFEESKAYLRSSADRVTVTGMLLPQSLQKISRQEAAEFFGFDVSGFTVLVMGGSQGSHVLNECFLEAFCGIEAGGGLQVIHITGDADYASVKERYRRMEIRACVYPFLAQMQYALSLADCACCRSGAMTIQELMFFRVPAILIPYPFAHGHQAANAGVLEKRGCAVIIKEEALSVLRLRRALQEIIFSPDTVGRLQSGYEGAAVPDAGGALVIATTVL